MRIARSRVLQFTAGSLLLSSCGDDRDAEKGVPSEPASCEAYVMNDVEQCGNDDPAFWIERCEESRLTYEPMGCGKEYARYVRCYSNAKLDCESGYPEGCPDSDIYLLCQAGFVQSTGCLRADRLDESCDEGVFGFTCLDGLPKNCTKLADASLGEDACCTPFGDQTNYFAD